jgi:hypothetical protein
MARREEGGPRFEKISRRDRFWRGKTGFQEPSTTEMATVLTVALPSRADLMSTPFGIRPTIVNDLRPQTEIGNLRANGTADLDQSTLILRVASQNSVSRSHSPRVAASSTVGDYTENQECRQDGSKGLASAGSSRQS